MAAVVPKQARISLQEVSPISPVLRRQTSNPVTQDPFPTCTSARARGGPSPTTSKFSVSRANSQTWCEVPIPPPDDGQNLPIHTARERQKQTKNESLAFWAGKRGDSAEQTSRFFALLQGDL